MDPALGGLASWEIVEPQGAAAHGESRAHIVWRLDMGAMKRHFDQDAGAMADGETLRTPRGSIAAWREDSATPRARAAGRLSPPSFYCDGDSVEFFSRTNSRWMPAVVHVRRGRRTHGGSKATVRYHVMVRTGGLKSQIRYDIPLGLLRYPLVVGEAVELYRGPSGWAAASVEGATAVHQLTLRLEEDGSVAQGVSPSQVRRRFVEGQPVRFFEAAVGWLDAVVDSGVAAMDNIEDAIVVGGALGALEDFVGPDGVQESLRPAVPLRLGETALTLAPPRLVMPAWASI